MTLSDKVQTLKDCMYNFNSVLGFTPNDIKLFKYSFSLLNNSDLISDCCVQVNSFKEACSIVKILVSDTDNPKIEKVLSLSEFDESHKLYLHLFKVIPLP